MSTKHCWAVTIDAVLVCLEKVHAFHISNSSLRGCPGPSKAVSGKFQDPKFDSRYSIWILCILYTFIIIYLWWCWFIWFIFPGSPYCICDAQVLEIKILSTSNFLGELWVRVCRLAHILDIDTNTEKPMVQSHQVRHTSKAEDAQFHMKCFIDGFKHASYIYIYYTILYYITI